MDFMGRPGASDESRLHSLAAEPCEYCDDWEICADRRVGEPSPPACFLPRRALDLGRVRAHLARLRRAAGLSSEPLAAMERVLLAHLGRAMAHYSNILEFSHSAREARSSPYRLSYALSAFGRGRADRERDVCRRLCRAFGGAAERVADRVLGEADPELVLQPLFGIDAEPGGLRLKLYLQFPEGRAVEKLALLARLVPAVARRRPADALERLHLLGVDFGPGGVLGVKLYWLRAAVPLAALRRAFPRAAVLRYLAARRGLRALDDVVLIARFGPHGGPLGPPVAELDLGLRANGLGWGDLARFYARRAAGRSFAAFARTALARHRWAATRISVPASGAGKLNVYYVLLDAPRGGGR